MKKVLSILLAVVLVFGMLPASALTVFAAEETATLSFASQTYRTSYATDKVVYSNNGITMTNNKGTYNQALRDNSGDDHVRFYGGTEVIIDCANGNIASMVFTCTSSSYATALKNSITTGATATASGTTVTVTLSTAVPSYTIDSISAQTRVKSVDVTYEVTGGETPDPEPGCTTHENAYLLEETAVAATCTTAGKEADLYCPDCDKVVQTGAEIKALGHNYVDGVCTNGCGIPEPEAPEIPTDGYYKQVTALSDVTAGGKFVIVAANDDKNYALSLTTSGGKPAGVEVTVVSDSIVTDDISTLPGWVIVPTDGGIALQNGDKYLSYGSSGTDFGVSSTPYTWSVEEGIHINATTGSNRAVMYRISATAFGGYSTTNATNSDYVYDLKLYKLVEGEAEVVESTLTFKELGTTKTETAEATKSYTMPAATNAAPAGYTFAGWVEAQILEETAIAPETVYAAGSSYTVGNDATFYALYTRTEVQSGGSATAYVAKNISEINDGDVVVITMTKDSTIYALPNNGGASTPSASETATVNSDGHLAANFDVVTWVISKDGDNLVFYVNGDSESWLYCLADNNSGVRVGDGAAKTFVVDAATGYLMNIETTSNRHIGVYQTKDWRCYKPSGSSVGNNIAGQTLAFYVKTAISGTVETDYYTTCVHNYASTSETTLTCQYCGTTKAAAASVNGTAYETVEQAIASAAGTVKLQQAIESITVDGDLYLDLNGHKATNVTANAIYACDSSASAAAAGTGSITTSSEVVMDNTVNNIRYIALEDNGVYTFHVLEMKLSAVTLRANEECGIYYKATYACDDTLKGKINSYGVVFSLDNMPGADFKTEENDRNLYTVYEKDSFVSGATVTSGSIFGIMKKDLENNADRGKMKIYANAYIIINGVNNGEPLMADVTNAGTTWTEGYTGVAYSLFDVMDKLDDDENWAKLKTDQQALIKQFYTDWYEAGMKNWSFSNITKIESA